MSEQTEMQSTANQQDQIVVRNSPPSFDDFDAIESTKVREAQLKEQEESHIKKELKKEKKEAKPKKEVKEDGKETEAKAETETEADILDEKEEETSKTESKEEGEEEKVAKPEKPSKIVKVKAGEETFKIPSDATVPVKIDGKIEYKPLQEILGGFSGQSHLDRQFASFRKEKQTFETQRSSLQKAVNDFHDLMVNKKDLRGGIEYIAEMMGADPQKTWNDLVPSIQESWGKYSQLSEEEKKVFDLEQENLALKRKHERENERVKIQEEKAQLEQKARKAMEDYGLSERDLVDADDQLKESEQFKDNYTLDDLVYLARHNRATKRAEQVLDKLLPEYDKRDQAVKDLREELMRDTLSDQDLENIVTEVYAQEPARRLAKKINKPLSRVKKEAPLNPAKEPVFFGDLD